METERQYLLKKAGIVAMAKLYPGGFEELTPKDRVLAYYLYEAAAGRDIIYDQNYLQRLAIRSVLAAVVTHSRQTKQAIMKHQSKYPSKI